jgi:hypothetical protein
MGIIALVFAWRVPVSLQESLVRARTSPILQRFRWHNVKPELYLSLTYGSWGYLFIPYAIWCAWNEIVPVAAMMAFSAVVVPNPPPWSFAHLMHEKDRYTIE